MTVTMQGAGFAHSLHQLGMVNDACEHEELLGFDDEAARRS